MCKLYLEGKTQEALKLQLDLLPLINQLFVEVNPIPVKASCAKMGFGENYLRLPLTPMEEKNAKLFVNAPNALAGNEISKCDSSNAAFQAKISGIVDVVSGCGRRDYPPEIKFA